MRRSLKEICYFGSCERNRSHIELCHEQEVFLLKEQVILDREFIIALAKLLIAA